jgi:chromate transport protein ChrA
MEQARSEMVDGVERLKDEHACCRQEAVSERTVKARKSLKSYIVGGVAAVVACLCCFLPLIPLMLGLSGALSFKEQLGPYQWTFEVLAVSVIVGACCYMWKEHRKSGKSWRSFILVVLATIVMYALMSFVMRELLVPAVLGGIMPSLNHGKH